MTPPRSIVKWLYPGLWIKRWLGLALGGATLFGFGALSVIRQGTWMARLAGGLAGMLGMSLLWIGLLRAVQSLLDAAAPMARCNLLEAVYHRRCLARGPRIVAIGGGTGLPTLLAGLKAQTNNLTAIVTAADDGGSSGRLRQEFGILPPGDLRNCLVALAEAEPLMQELFQYRFEEGNGLNGHSVGNLCVTALTRMTGDFERAVQAGNRVLGVRGRVVPSTYDEIRLVAEHEDGSRTVGESHITVAARPIRRLRLEPQAPRASRQALDAIRAADLIVLGPGSLFTSVLPNLLVPQLLSAILRARAITVYICNVMTQYRETYGFAASDHVRALIDHTHPTLVDWVVVNTGQIPEALLAAYGRQQSAPVEADREAVRALGYRVLTGDLISREGGVVRHDPRKLARAVLSLPRKALQADGYHSNGHGAREQ